jgi:dTDP-glucose pyrophosphorylase/CBS domain-containing protein
MRIFSENTIDHNESIKDALRKLDEFGPRINLTLFVIDKAKKVIGTVTDGDIRRGLLSGKKIEDSIVDVMHLNFKYLKANDAENIGLIREYRSQGILIIPVLDDEGCILDLFSVKDRITILPIQVVLMAGGVGERLRPLTETIPKPMLKVGERPIIEHNVNRLIRFGVKNITISIGYLGNKIEEYFGDGSPWNINVSYIRESYPMGTIGSLALLTNKLSEYILVMNSDLLTNIDYEAFFTRFVNEDADICIAAIPYNVNIPYAILDIENDQIVSLQEKPSYTYYASAGIYLMKSSILKHIPLEGKFDAPDLIENLIAEGKKVISYQILEYWLDVGKPEDYKKAQDDIIHLNL